MGQGWNWSGFFDYLFNPLHPERRGDHAVAHARGDRRRAGRRMRAGPGPALQPPLAGRAGALLHLGVPRHAAAGAADHHLHRPAAARAQAVGDRVGAARPDPQRSGLPRRDRPRRHPVGAGWARPTRRARVGFSSAQTMRYIVHAAGHAARSSRRWATASTAC